MGHHDSAHLFGLAGIESLASMVGLLGVPSRLLAVGVPRQ